MKETCLVIYWLYQKVDFPFEESQSKLSSES